MLSAMNPTYSGYIGSTKDALLIIQAVLNGQLLPVPRRPHDRERNLLIQSGNVFVFIEERSGIKRWTDGVAWSPSRILGRFLVYRELDRQALSAKDKGKYGDKSGKKSRKSSVDGSELSSSGMNNNTVNNLGMSSSQVLSTATGSSAVQPNRSLVGSLIASYAFKEYGLIKKTLSLTVAKVETTETIHLVSYYSAEDVLSGKLIRPVDTASLKDIQLSPELWAAVKESSLGGKIPIEDEAYYFMDQSNPNAVALGFNPAIHLQPQYQQYNQQQHSHHQTQQQPQQQQQQPPSQHQQQQSQQQQQQMLHHPQSFSSASQPVSNYALGGVPFGGFNAPLPFSQFPPPPHHHHHIHHPHGHQQSSSFSLPHPLTNHHHSNSISSGTNGQDNSPYTINDFNVPVGYPPRFSPNQNFVPTTASNPGTNNSSLSSTGTSGTSMSSASYNGMTHRPPSPSSPTKVKSEYLSKTSTPNYNVAGGHLSSLMSSNTDSQPVLQNANVSSNSLPRNGALDGNPNNSGNVIPGVIPSLTSSSNSVSGNQAGKTWYYDDFNQGYVGTGAAGYSQFSQHH